MKAIYTFLIIVIVVIMTIPLVTAQDCSLNGGTATDNCPVGTTGDDDYLITGPVTTSVQPDAGFDTVMITGGSINVPFATGGHGIYDTDGGVTVGGGSIAATGGWDGIWSEGDGSVSSSATITANWDGSVGIAESGAGDITNDGAISSSGLQSFGVLEVEAGDVVNNGSISTTGSSAYGIYELGDGSVTNNGSIITNGSNAYGINENSTGDVINNGSIVVIATGSTALYESGAGNVTNNGSVTATNGIGINTSSGVEDDTVTNNGTVSGTTAAIITGSGNDTVINNGTINGDVNLGNGDDVMQVSDGAVNGLMDGGAGTDTLIFDLTFVGTEAEYLAIANQIAAANPAGGTLTIDGQSYVWVNFETLLNLLQFISNSPRISKIVEASPPPPQPCAFDGRINSFDCQAPVTLYGYPLRIWGIHPDTGAGTFAFQISQEQVDAVGIPETGTVLIAGGTHPDTGVSIAIYRHADGAFQINTWYPNGKPYVGIWSIGDGFTNLSGEQS